MNFKKLHLFARVIFVGLTVTALVAYVLDAKWLAGLIVVGLVGVTSMMALEMVAMQRAAIRLTKNLPRKVEKRLPATTAPRRRSRASSDSSGGVDVAELSARIDGVVDVVKTLQAQYVGRLDRMQDTIESYVAESEREEASN